jgi:hypothetical protein
MDVMTPEQIEELETGETRRVILNAYWKPCVHGGGWWIAKDADGVDRLLAPDDFADTLEAEVLRLTEANAALAEELARSRNSLAEVMAFALSKMDDRTRADEMPMFRRARAALSHTGMTGQREGV